MLLNQKRVLGVVGLLFAFIIITIILNSIKSSMEDKQSLKDLTDENVLYEIQTIVNGLYNDEYPEPSYISNKILYSEDGLNNVYFVNGYLTKIKEEGIDYQKNVNYLIITNGIYYEIEKIEEADIEKYAEKFLSEHKVIDLEVTNQNVIPSTNYDEKAKLTLYISNFSELLKVDPQKAYELLSKEEKKNYTSAEDLKNNFNLNIDAGIESSSKKKSTYTIKDYNDNTIVIQENKLLDYTIEFD